MISFLSIGHLGLLVNKIKAQKSKFSLPSSEGNSTKYLAYSHSGVEEGGAGGSPPSCDLREPKPPDLCELFWKYEHRRIIYLL